ncbi:MAG: 30S ribosome-binding factor RbfA [Alphaproteobacteria bacterium]|jgi:ribosome-binding factor A|nr:30S ribosome-binding factor RbfA [Alphaproteobacteria bacterium]MDP6565152.1 30S ribosome-binding factor RbfA [Alphaproteobacteria bacterium]MDP6812327.1 30S ribosome-binding factor RbfA [Alphaproteobacteria bacterium]
MAKHGGSRQRARGPSQRQLRAGELIRHALAEVLTREEIHDADLADVPVTVSEVGMSADLRHATCYVMPLGGEGIEPVLAALNRVAPWLASQVARRVRLKFAPRLEFRVDESFDNAGHIDRLLRRDDIAADLAAGDDEGDGDGA